MTRFETGRPASRSNHLGNLAAAVIAGMLVSNGAIAGDWTGFLGTNGDGKSTETGVIPAQGDIAVTVDWTVPGGSGYSAISVAGDSVVTMMKDESNDVMVNLDAKTGKPKWHFVIEPTYEGHDGSHDGPIATPLINGNTVFGLGARGRLFAAKLDSGEVLWSTSLTEEHNCPPQFYGFGCSPKIVDGTLVVQIGSKDGAVAGFDPKTGERKWLSGEDSIAYHFPIVDESTGQKLVIGVGGKKLFLIDPKDGTLKGEAAHFAGPGRGTMCIVPVRVGPDQIYLNQQAGGSAVAKIKTNDGLTLEKVWDGNSIKNTYNIPVYHEGHLYAYSTRFLTCVDAETGSPVWKSRAPGDGFLTFVDDHLAIITKDGSLHIVKATPEGYEERAGAKLFDEVVWMHPAVANGAIYVRSMDRISKARVVPIEQLAKSRRAGDPENFGDPAGSEFGRWLKRLESAENKKAEIDSYLAGHKDMPIVEGDEWVHFIYRGEGKDLALAGDMFGARRERSMHRAPGTDLFYYSMKLPADVRLNYMFMKDFKAMTDPANSRKAGTTFVNEEMEMNFGPQVLPMSWFAMPKWKKPSYIVEAPADRRGTLELKDINSDKLGDKVNFKVYLPHGYESGDKEYPVAYVHGGMSALERGHWKESLDNLIGTEIEPIIAVFIPPAGFGKAQQQLDMIVNELVPYVDENYRTVKVSSGRACIGGGFPAIDAINAVFSNPDMFGKLGSQSMFKFGSFAPPLEKMIPSPGENPLTVYFEWGAYDFRNPHEAWDMAETNREFAELLRESGLKLNGGQVNDGTDWSSWANRTDDLLKTLFPI